MHCVHACVALLALCRPACACACARVSRPQCASWCGSDEMWPADGEALMFGWIGTWASRVGASRITLCGKGGGMFWDASHCFSLAHLPPGWAMIAACVCLCALRFEGLEGGGAAVVRSRWGLFGSLGDGTENMDGHTTHSASISVWSSDTVSAGVIWTPRHAQASKRHHFILPTFADEICPPDAVPDLFLVAEGGVGHEGLVQAGSEVLVA